jgi:hypothetical protein
VYLGDSSSLAYQVFFHHFVGVTVHFGVDWFPQSSYYNGEKAEDGSHFTGTPWSDLENGVCSLGCSATAYVRIRYQQLERIRTAAPAGAIAVAYFALRWLIRVQGLLSAPSSCKYGTTQSLPQCEYLIIYYAGGCSSTDLLRLLVAQNYLLYPYCDYILGRLHLYVVRSSSRWEFLCWVSCWYRSGATVYYILDIHTLAITYVRISSWSAYVLLLLLVQSQWRTLRSAVWYAYMVAGALPIAGTVLHRRPHSVSSS